MDLADELKKLEMVSGEDSDDDEYINNNKVKIKRKQVRKDDRILQCKKVNDQVKYGGSNLFHL